MMKRITAFITAFILLCVPFGILAEEDIWGVWYLSEVIMNGESADAAETGVVISIELMQDDTFVMTTDGEQSIGIWSQEGNRYILNGLETTIADGTLTVDVDGVIMVFSRQAYEASIPQPVPAESPEEFYGEWELDRIGGGIVIMPARTIPDDMDVKWTTVEIDEASLIIVLRTDGEEHRLRFDTELKDGKLIPSSETDEITNIRLFPVEKTDDGGIRVILEGETEMYTLYMKRK